VPKVKAGKTAVETRSLCGRNRNIECISKHYFDAW